jgi:threonine synthase
MSIWKYADWWGAPPQAKVSLGEGGTPLVRSIRLGEELGLKQLWFKCENANPTGSYKDRFAAAAISHLRHDGKKICLGTSSGNTGAALAAYCARAGIPCVLAIVEGAPEGKLRQMLAYGAHLFRIKRFGSSPEVTTEVISGLRVLAGELGAGFEISAFSCSPRGMAGVQSLGFEIAEAFSGDTARAPDMEINVFSPAGGGGLTLAVARGFATAATHGAWPGRARIHCVQPAGNDTMATALRDGSGHARAVESRTAISGLQVGSVIDGDATIEACRRSGGQGHVVADERVWEWQARLARAEGIFSEPAGAVALAGVEAALARGELHPDDTIVCLVTGSGFKDERSLVRMTGDHIAPLVGGFPEFAAKARSSLAL